MISFFLHVRTHSHERYEKLDSLITYWSEAEYNMTIFPKQNWLLNHNKWRLHFNKVSIDSVLLDNLLRWGRINMPLEENTRSTGAEVAGMQRTGRRDNDHCQRGTKDYVFLLPYRRQLLALALSVKYCLDKHSMNLILPSTSEGSTSFGHVHTSAR